MLPTDVPPSGDTLTVDQQEASRLTNVSAKTLERLAAAGEPVGRFKVGHRVLYHRATLAAWLAARAAGHAATNPTNHTN